jgi:hypothetical protein
MTMLAFDFEGWAHRESAADPAVVAALSAASGIKLPEEYLSLLCLSNGGEGPLGVEPGWFVFWPAEKVLALNRGYEVHEYLPGLFGFGSNGGGELLAFDTRRGPPWPVVMVPFIGMDADDVVEIAKDFEGFLQATGRDSPDG